MRKYFLLSVFLCLVSSLHAQNKLELVSPNGELKVSFNLSDKMCIRDSCCACAVMASIAYLFPKYIKKMVKENGNNTFTVTLFDPKGKAVEIGAVSYTHLATSPGRRPAIEADRLAVGILMASISIVDCAPTTDTLR